MDVQFTKTKQFEVKLKIYPFSMSESLQSTFKCGLCKVTYDQSVPRRLPCQSIVICEACILVHQDRLVFHCPVCDQTHSALQVFFSPEKPSRMTTAATTTSAEAVSEMMTTPTASPRSAATTPLSSSPNEDVKCPIHGLETSLFCKDDSCQRKVCTVCMMKNHSNHDIIAPENGFVYCRDPIVLGQVEILCERMKDMSVSTRKVKLEVPPGDGNQEPEEAKERTGNKTKPDENSSPIDIELVYDRELEWKKYLKWHNFKPMKRSNCY